MLHNEGVKSAMTTRNLEPN